MHYVYDAFIGKHLPAMACTGRTTRAGNLLFVTYRRKALTGTRVHRSRPGAWLMAGKPAEPTSRPALWLPPGPRIPCSDPSHHTWGTLADRLSSAPEPQTSLRNHCRCIHRWACRSSPPETVSSMTHRIINRPQPHANTFSPSEIRENLLINLLTISEAAL